MVDRIQDDKAIFMLHSLRLLYGERNLCMPTRVPCMIFERSPKWIFLKRFFCTSNATCTKFAYNELEKKCRWLCLAITIDHCLTTSLSYLSAIFIEPMPNQPCFL
ncbi:Os02g0216500 [Oryza sativa Japonica Group]|uniref:Os02g0216500 protein n=1 Tax=Oryza sativa subsp. japonica TaxID=39947 RepID=B7F1E4_ORYSJ|nr:hypothetical protein DAI22_02g090100 [Oryza sativa Japonica Group]KAF2943768.1 hypothetical protein DAI22_02g090100 [Oryza sativa Japonica Group]KAF2943769.1 hypothetical protein DAI22_02g090100 [Oryza sativa Japonica Group]BAG98441.1 unnamed protein product [Oryza sativa Japonica Group]BAS77653.1 Os02g0216500 [Oryza sativa Japonica Group]